MSAPLNFAFIECPACRNKLPPNAVRCQFCGVDVSRVPRPANMGPAKKHYGEFETPKWINALYYVLCGWWAFSGVLQILLTYYEVMTRKPSKLEVMMHVSSQGIFTLFDYFAIFIGAITFLIGVCLAFKVRWVREMMNWLGLICIVCSLLSLIGSILSIALVGAFGILFVLKDVFDIAVAGGTIWLIGETD